VELGKRSRRAVGSIKQKTRIGKQLERVLSRRTISLHAVVRYVLSGYESHGRCEGWGKDEEGEFHGEGAMWNVRLWYREGSNRLWSHL
jgi:hypothetical protein